MDYYIEEVVLRPTGQENILDTGVADRIIEILGEAGSRIINIIEKYAK